MLYPKDNTFLESSSPHSLGLKNNLTIPNPGWDQNELMINEKKYWGAGIQGVAENNIRATTTLNYGMGGLTLDGTGLLGTGLFSGNPMTWGAGEVAALLGGYILFRHQIDRTLKRL